MTWELCHDDHRTHRDQSQGDAGEAGDPGDPHPRKLNEGAGETDLFDAYPRRTREDIKAAIRYAADTIAHEKTVLVEPTWRRAKR